MALRRIPHVVLKSPIANQIAYDIDNIPPIQIVFSLLAAVLCQDCVQGPLRPMWESVNICEHAFVVGPWCSASILWTNVSI